LLPDEPYEFKDRDIEELKKVLAVRALAPRDARQRPRSSLYGVHMVKGLSTAGREAGAGCAAALQIIPLT